MRFPLIPTQLGALNPTESPGQAFLNIHAYWRNSGIAEYLTKGAVVEISGWMEVQGYQSKAMA